MFLDRPGRREAAVGWHGDSKRRLLRFRSRARRYERSLERVERLHRKLALGRGIRGDVDRLTRRERLLLAIDVKRDGVVPGSANHSDRQVTVADNQSLIGLDCVGIRRGHNQI